jgi:hypothetical protein
VLAASAAISAALAFAAPAWPQSSDRLPDPDVKKLIETVDHDRDRFEDALDGKLKDSVQRGPGGEVDVKRYLDDLQENTKKLKDRFKNDYAASAEVQALLRQSSDIDRFMGRQEMSIKGRSEWDRMASDLRRLAGVYGTAFPLAADAAVRRISDREAAQAAEALSKQADAFKSALGKEKTLAPPAKDKLKAAAEALNKQARVLKSRLSDSKPATAEARQTIDAAAAVDAALAGTALSPTALTAWGEGRGPLDTIGQAFNLRR